MMKQRTILLVEDNPAEAELMYRALEKCKVNHPVVLVEDGQEALDYLFGAGAFMGRDPSDAPALILMDLKLPKVSGLEVLKRLRAQPATRRVPVVIMTSSNHEEDRATGYDYGVNSYVRKPVSFDDFVEAMKQLGAYWLSLNQEPPRAS